MKYQQDIVIPSYDGQSLAVQVCALVKHPTQDVILLHGLGGDSSAYLLFIEKLLQQFPELRCIAYDLRGHGNSTRSFPSNSRSQLEVHAHDLLAVCQFFHTQQPVIIGHCLGGAVIQEYLKLQFSPLPKLSVLICTATSFPHFSLLPQFWYTLLKLYSCFNHRSIRRSLSEHLKTKNGWDYDPRRIYSDIKTVGLTQFLLMHLSFYGWENDHPSALNSPNTVILCGEKDQVIRKKRRQKMRTLLNQAGYYALNSNHGAIINTPDEIVQILVQDYASFFQN